MLAVSVAALIAEIPLRSSSICGDENISIKRNITCFKAWNAGSSLVRSSDDASDFWYIVSLDLVCFNHAAESSSLIF
jgi:hypothetical protein